MIKLLYVFVSPYKSSQSIQSRHATKTNVTKTANVLQQKKQLQTSQPAQVISQWPSPLDSINALGIYIYIHSLIITVTIFEAKYIAKIPCLYAWLHACVGSYARFCHVKFVYYYTVVV